MRRGAWRRPARRRAVVCAALCVAACGDGEKEDRVAVVAYGQRALERGVKRRIRLLTAGVELRGDLAADTVWVNCQGYTFVGRRPEVVTDVRRVEGRRRGVPLRQRPGGLSRSGPAMYRLEPGWTLVDVFDPRDRYVASCAAPAGMDGRRLLQHLGLTRRHSAGCDRLYLPPDEVERWRELLPVVIRNRGFGYLYSRRSEPSEDEAAGADSTELLAERYDVEEEAGYVLVGKKRGSQQFRHIFAPGGEYRVTVIQYGEPFLQGRDLLALLGFALE